MSEEINKNSNTSRQEQAAKTNDKIFEAANELFNEKGFDKVTIRDICKKAEVALGTFYLYYKSKHDILYTVYVKADELYERDNISNRADLTSFEKLLELIRMQFNMATIFHVKSDSIKHLYAYQLETDNQYFLSEDRKFFRQLFQVVEQGKENGEIRIDISTHDICWRILRFSRGILYDWCLHNCNYDSVQFGVEEMRFYLELFDSKMTGKGGSK